MILRNVLKKNAQSERRFSQTLIVRPVPTTRLRKPEFPESAIEELVRLLKSSMSPISQAKLAFSALSTKSKIEVMTPNASEELVKLDKS